MQDQRHHAGSSVALCSSSRINVKQNTPPISDQDRQNLRLRVEQDNAQRHARDTSRMARAAPAATAMVPGTRECETWITEISLMDVRGERVSMIHTAPRPATIARRMRQWKLRSTHEKTRR